MADTIAAIATGNAPSAIGIIRISGENAVAVADRVFRPASGAAMAGAADRKLCYGSLTDAAGAVIDFCLCTVSRGPHTYTGEDTAELQCHGSPVVLAEGLRAVFAAGARQALPGEFTKRAFLNGRMDLTQAEAVIDLIQAETAAAAANAAGQLGRAIGRRTDAVYDQLVDIMAHFHAVLDYPDEEIDDFELSQYGEILQTAAGNLKALLRTFARGRILKEGIPAAIIGRPNAGKSSLLNALLGYDRAIVTNIAGTTRDTIEERVRVGEVVLRLSDTAGIRDTDDLVEQFGVQRAIAAAERASLVLAVFDGSTPWTGEDERVLQSAKCAPAAIAVVSKGDLPGKLDTGRLLEEMGYVCTVSSVTGAGIENLCGLIENLCYGEKDQIPQGEILTNARQAEAVKRALDGINASFEAISCRMTPDAVLTGVESALSALGEITGRVVREDITARIFERFCVGK